MQRLAADALSASSATLLIAPSKSSPRFAEVSLWGRRGEGRGEIESKGKVEVLRYAVFEARQHHLGEGSKRRTSMGGGWRGLQEEQNANSL